MRESLEELDARRHSLFDAWRKTKEVPLSTMGPEERRLVREAERALLEADRSWVPFTIASDSALARRSAALGHSIGDAVMLVTRLGQMVEEFELVRLSEERCLARPEDVELDAAESEYRAALAEAQALLDVLERPMFERCRYLGGYRFLPKPIDPVVLWFAPDMKWICVNAAGAPGQVYSAEDALRIPWGEINGISVEGPEEIRRRVTATRAATIGLFALAFKKREKQAVLVLETKNDDAFFEVDGFDSVALRAQLSGWKRYFELAAWTRDYKPPLGRGGGPTPPEDPFDQLRKLAALKAAGLVTEQEFEEKRVMLLKRI